MHLAIWSDCCGSEWKPENPGAYFGAYCLFFRPELPLNSGNGIWFIVMFAPYKSTLPGILRKRWETLKTAWEPLQNLYSPVRIWMAPHTKTLQNQCLQGFSFASDFGVHGVRGLFRGLPIILPFFSSSLLRSRRSWHRSYSCIISNCLTAAFSNPVPAGFKPHGFKPVGRRKAQFSKGSRLSNHVFQLDVWSSTVGRTARNYKR